MRADVSADPQPRNSRSEGSSSRQRGWPPRTNGHVPLSEGHCAQVTTENQVWPDPVFPPPQLGATSERKERKNLDLTETKVLPEAEWGIKAEIAFSFFFPHMTWRPMRFILLYSREPLSDGAMF